MPEPIRAEFGHAVIPAVMGPPFVTEADCVAAIEVLVAMLRGPIAQRRAEPTVNLIGTGVAALLADPGQLAVPAAELTVGPGFLFHGLEALPVGLA